MIHLIHGNDLVQSRNKLTSLITKASKLSHEIIYLNGLECNLEDVKQALESESLLKKEKLVILENLFSRPKSQLKDQLISYLKKEEIVQDVLIWEKKEIPGTILRWLPKNYNLTKFNIPVVIFKFLENLKPQNTKQALKLYFNCLKTNTPEMIFYMIARQIRLLLIANDLGKSGLAGAPWYINKLTSQASKFSLKKLISVYQKLLEIDINIKTGRSFMPLKWHLEMMLVNM